MARLVKQSRGTGKTETMLNSIKEAEGGELTWVFAVKTDMVIVGSEIFFDAYSRDDFIQLYRETVALPNEHVTFNNTTWITEEFTECTHNIY